MITVGDKIIFLDIARNYFILTIHRDITLMPHIKILCNHRTISFIMKQIQVKTFIMALRFFRFLLFQKNRSQYRSKRYEAKTLLK